MTALKIYFIEQALLVGTEQSRGVNKAVGPLPAVVNAAFLSFETSKLWALICIICR